MNLLGTPNASEKFRFEDLELSFPDAYRGQYFLTPLKKEAERLFRAISTERMVAANAPNLIEPFFSSLIEELDQLILPIVIHEISIAREMNLLKGNSPGARYESFFVDEKSLMFTNSARSLICRYPILFKMLDGAIQNAVQCAIQCVSHLIQDFRLLQDNGFVHEIDSLQSLDLVGKSDPHMQNRTFLLTFASGKKIIHKSVDLFADQLFGQFILKLSLPPPYNLRTMRVIPKSHDYGWMEYISYQSCETHQQIRDFYKRAGALTAVADCLNYSDGHFENVIALGQYPILLDGETLFQNYAAPERKKHQKKNLLGTSLIQKPPPREMLIGYSAAFQTLPTTLLEVVFPFALNDHTDQIELHYRGTRNETALNCPSMGNQYYTIHTFIQEFIEGFSFAFDQIKIKKQELLSDVNWWDNVAQVKSRTVLRDTLAYYYLLRRIQRPEACISEITMRNILESKLGETPYTSYEINELMQINIPYFYHYPGQRDLHQGNVKKHRYFLKTGIECLKEQLEEWDENYKQFSIKILEKHLPSTPLTGELAYYKL